MLRLMLMLMFLILWSLMGLAAYYLIRRRFLTECSWLNGDRIFWLAMCFVSAPITFATGVILTLHPWLERPAKW